MNYRSEVIRKGDTFLMWWSVFFEKVIRVNKNYYQGEALVIKHEDLLYKYQSIGKKFTVSDEKISLLINENESITDDEIDKIERLLSCKVQHNEVAIFLYNETNEYRFGNWIRKPFSSCPKCMATPFGTVIYWMIILLNDRWFKWANQKLLSELFFYIIFVCVLSFTNSIIYKRTKHYV